MVERQYLVACFQCLNRAVSCRGSNKRPNPHTLCAHAGNAAADACRTVSALVSLKLEKIRRSELRRVLSRKMYARKYCPVFLALDDALDVSIHAAREVCAVARGDNGQVRIAPQRVGGETSACQLAFSMPGRHGYHQAWRSAFPHVKQKGVQRRADFFMHPAHEVMRARRVYEADERLLRQCLLNKPQVRLFTPHHGKPPLPFWQRPLGTFPKGQWIPVTLATCFRPVTQVPSCLSPSYPGVSCTGKSDTPYPSA